MKIRIIHRACGKPAFLYEEEHLVGGVPVQARYAEHLDGGTICAGEKCTCDSCGAWIAPNAENLSREGGASLT